MRFLYENNGAPEYYFEMPNLMARLAANAPEGKMLDEPEEVRWFMDSVGTGAIRAVLYVATATGAVHSRHLDMGCLPSLQDRIAICERMMKSFMAEGLIIRPRTPVLRTVVLTGPGTVIMLPWDGPR